MCVCVCVLRVKFGTIRPIVIELDMNIMPLSNTDGRRSWGLIRANPGDKAGGAHWLRGLVGLGAVLDRQIFIRKPLLEGPKVVISRELGNVDYVQQKVLL